VIKDDLQTTNGQPDSSVDQWIEVGLKKRQTPSAVANVNAPINSNNGIFEILIRRL
jgi:hypothetical protein